MRRRKKSSSGLDKARPVNNRHLSLWRTASITSGLVVAAVLVGVLFYAQAGLLVSKPSAAKSPGQTKEPSQIPQALKPSEQLQQSALGVQDSVPMAAEETPAPPPQTKQQPSKPQKTCDEKAKDGAKKIYDRSMSTEDTLHKQNLADISQLSKLLGSLGLSRDRTAAENNRHNTAVEAITTKYQQALVMFRCQP